ncbi:MAG: hypothetical protein V3T56_02245 [Gemmatimonadales bacterium]
MRVLTLAAVFSCVVASVGVGQTLPLPQAQQQREPQPEDTIPVPKFRADPPVSPLGGAWRSLLIPGWGQSILGRRVTGAAFVFWEGVTLFMTVKSSHQLSYLTSIDADPELIASKRAEFQDWAVLLAFNHLLAAAEAYVSTLFWDFPADLTVGGTQEGGVEFGVHFSF